MARAPSGSVPAAVKPAYEAIVAFTDVFCQQHLTDEYMPVCRRMAAALARKRPSPLLSGKPNTWACGIAYAVCSDNFVFDKSHQPYLSATEIAGAFDLAKTTAAGKATAIRATLKLQPYDWHYTVESGLLHNPTAWFIMVDGLIVDARRLPPDIQRVAYEKGLIPGVVVSSSIIAKDDADEDHD